MPTLVVSVDFELMERLRVARTRYCPRDAVVANRFGGSGTFSAYIRQLLVAGLNAKDVEDPPVLFVFKQARNVQPVIRPHGFTPEQCAATIADWGLNAARFEVKKRKAQKVKSKKRGGKK